jgi:pyruvate kinase
VDVLRLNFSHGTQDEHGRTIAAARRIARELGRPLAILQDLQGPRLRVGLLGNGAARLTPGQRFTLTTRDVEGTESLVNVSYPALPKEITEGQRVLLDDGRLKLRAVAIEGQDIHCKVEVGGILRDHKGINVPEVRLSAPCLTEKDLDDLQYGLRQGIDYIALSFVRSAQDARMLRTELARQRVRVPILAKIEKAEAAESIEEIVRAFDGVMVARGDLGVEIGPERVPLIQKEIIKEANDQDKFVITATQMLESMVNSPTPTRAEASDVANAILDGTDAVMLSAETSIGMYPVEAVDMMDSIAREVDAVALPYRPPKASYPAQAVVRAAHDLALEVGAKAINVITTSGRTAHLMAKYRPPVPVYAFTKTQEVYNALAMWWGITPLVAPFLPGTTEMVQYMEDVMLGMGAARPGDRLIIVGSTPVIAAGRTNFLKVHTILRRRQKNEVFAA